jgi:hypothetical protein
MTHIVIDANPFPTTYAVGSSARTVFALPGAYFENSNIVVTVGGHTLILDTDYTISGTAVDAGFSSGTVTLVTAVTNTTVVVDRILPITRTTDFPESGPLSIRALNTQLDRIVAMIQQLVAQIAAIAQSFIDFRALFATLINADTTVTLFDTLNAFTLATIGAGVTHVRTAGRYTVGDGGQALYKVISAPSPVQLWHAVSANGVYIEYVPEGDINPRAIGAKGDLSQDDQPYIQAAVNFAASRRIHAPIGNYRMDSGVSYTGVINLYGDGSGGGPGQVATANCTRFVVNFSSGDVFTSTSIFPSTFHKIQIDTAVAARPRTLGAALFITAPAGNTNANTEISECAFSHQYKCIDLLLLAQPKIIGNYFEYWVHSGVHARTTAGVEGSGGRIEHNYFFGDSGSTTQVACIMTEVGYVTISKNLILGAAKGIAVVIANNAAGSVRINDNFIENQGIYGIHVSTSDGSACAMLSIERNEFSNLSFVGNWVTGILILDYSSQYLFDFAIRDNVHRHNASVNHRFIWVQSGNNGIISGEILQNIGAGASTVGIDVRTFSDTDLAAPISVVDCQFTGTFASRYQIDSKTTIRDMQGTAFAALPTCADGSTVFVTDGTHLSNPLTGGGTGAFAKRLNGAWAG